MYHTDRRCALTGYLWLSLPVLPFLTHLEIKDVFIRSVHQNQMTAGVETRQAQDSNTLFQS